MSICKRDIKIKINFDFRLSISKSHISNHFFLIIQHIALFVLQFIQLHGAVLELLCHDRVSGGGCGALHHPRQLLVHGGRYVESNNKNKRMTWSFSNPIRSFKVNFLNLIGNSFLQPVHQLVPLTKGWHCVRLPTVGTYLK